ncbi:MAG: hypothetical protein RLZZ488_1514 [Pseudomonadota bacterium]
MNFFCSDFDVVCELSNQFGRQTDDVFVFQSLKAKVTEKIFCENLVIQWLSALCSLLSDSVHCVHECFHRSLSYDSAFDFGSLKANTVPILKFGDRAYDLEHPLQLLREGGIASVSGKHHLEGYVSHFGDGMGLTTLSQMAKASGLHTLDSKVFVPNFEFPVVGERDADAAPAPESLFCDKEGGRPADLTALYFTLPECENCRAGARALERLQEAHPPVAGALAPTVCARIVVSDWPTLPELGLEYRATGLRSLKGIIWDPQGVLSERLSVVAHPAFFLLDRDGELLAYQNGPVEFASAGFEVFWNNLLGDVRKAAQEGEALAAGRLVNRERNYLSSQPVSFLDQGPLSAVWLVVLLLLCYHLIRFFLRLRKNFTGSQN